MGQIEQRLVAVLRRQRREAIGYSVLTVLCTPFFVALIGLAVVIIIAFIFSVARYDMLELTYGGHHFVAGTEDYAVE
ncbi:MAG: hypothetical protein ACYSWO_00310 [Planctomycetota bacterium]|jgi:hypothetical protein